MKQIKIIFSLGVAAFLLNSCNKETGYNIANQATPVPNSVGFVYVQNNSIDTRIGQTVSAEVSSTPLAIDIYAEVNSSYNNYAATDIQIDQDDAAVANYDATLTPLPAVAFNFVSKTATVDPTTHVATFRLNVLGNQIPSTGTYAIGVSIKSVSNKSVVIATNRMTKVYVVKVKNPLEAAYAVTGYFFHPSSPRAISRNKNISTVSSVRITTDLGDLGGSNYKMEFDFNSGTNTFSNWKEAGATPPVPASGFFTSTNPGNQTSYPGSTPAGLYVHSTYNNTYSPSAKTLWLHYGYGVGASAETGYSRMVFEKWVQK